MKIVCPNCGTEVPVTDINVQADLALCRECEQAFAPSKLLKAPEISASTIAEPPRGCWFREEWDTTILGSTTRSMAALFVVPFTCVWAGGSLGGIYGSQILRGRFDLVQSLFGIPFLIGSIVLVSLSLMMVFGKVEIRLKGSRGVLFTGVGKIGRPRSFDLTEVTEIREQASANSESSSSIASIVLEGKNRLSFGSGLAENRRYFLLHALRYLHLKQK